MAGFTLIEVTVVLVVLALLVGLLVGRGPLRSTALDLRATAATLAAALRATRAEAITDNRRAMFTLDVAQHSFRLDDGPMHRLPAAIGLSMRTIAGATAGNRVAALSFAPDGSSSGGSITLAAGDRRVELLVDWLTGRVSVGDGR